MFGCGGIHLVFHLKHYGYYLHSALITFTVDKIALAACSGIVVLFKVCIAKCGSP